MLESTVWHFSDHGDVGIDPDAAKVEGFGHAHRATMILRPDA